MSHDDDRRVRAWLLVLVQQVEALQYTNRLSKGHLETRLERTRHRPTTTRSINGNQSNTRHLANAIEKDANVPQTARWETIEYIRIQQESQSVILHSRTTYCAVPTRRCLLPPPMLNVDDSRVQKIRRKNAIDYVEISSGGWQHSAY